MPREIWVLVTAALAVALGYGIVAPIIPQFARSFDVSVTAASALTSVFAAMRIAFSTPGGKLIDIFGERKMYMTGLLIVALSSAASGLAQNYIQLLILRGVGGIGSIVFSVSAMSLIIKLSPPGQRGRASSLYGSAFLLGNILGPSLGSLLAVWGMRLPFFIYAGTLMISFFVIFFALPEPHRQEISKEEGGIKPMTVGEAVSSPTYRAVLVTGFSHAWTNMGVRLTMIPLATGVAMGYGEWVSGAALTAGAIGTAISLVAGGGLSDKYGRMTVIVPGLVVAGIMTIIFGTLENPFLLVSVALVTGLGAGLIQPGQQGAVADVLDGRPGGKVVSTFQMAGDLGQIVGPLLAGLIADNFGYSYAFMISGAILIAAVAAWLPARGDSYLGYRRGSKG
ncbi:MFS transporter [Flaviflexus huanghaiensis]|uniref:MFS transporter n=1 Tax=Flaviflexus huanghaiensis TaxID=1111473 RepID=UPI0019D5BCD0|nr:MFS transporter [Flaviflexus huanghaiensis]